MIPIMKIIGNEWPVIKPQYFKLRESTRDILYSTVRSELKYMWVRRDPIENKSDDSD